MDIVRERSLDIKALQDRVDALHRVVASSFRDNRERSRRATDRGQLANFKPGGLRPYGP